MTKAKCIYYENPSCALNHDTCELAHSSSIGYQNNCLIYEMRHIYQKWRNNPNQQARNERLVANARVLSLQIEKEA